MRVKLLGRFSVSVGNRIIEKDEWRLRKASALVKLLALASGHRLHRERLMDLLWPDLGRKAASNSLRGTLHAARKTLDPTEGSGHLASEGESLMLCSKGDLWVDVDAFEDAAATARRARDPAAYRLATTLYVGELLPGDQYEEWAENRREELRQLQLALLTELAGLYEERGEHEAATETLRSAVAEDPTFEEAHAGLMRVYTLSERRMQALTQYERLREVLSVGLGMEPSASTRQLYDEIAAGRFLSSEPTSHSADESQDAGKHNLPATRSSFVGREAVVGEVKRDLAMTRLLTLTGAGGCGKTRIALEVAREMVGAYPDGVWLVELASLSEGTLVARAVATALGVQEQPDRSITDTLVNFLRASGVLLVLDNCEHLLDAVARLTDVLLDSCPHLRVLATSRESLNVEGELNWLVPSLSVPGVGQSPRVEELAGYESVRLFVERASSRNPAFSLTPENAHAVARICERLEGMPLAIELAAARVGLSVEQIATRLDDSLRLLSAGSRTASPRQRTLRGTLDWSYALLSEPERSLFGRLSVFAGGWTLEAAEAVGAGDTAQGDVLGLLSRLVEKSLVVAEAIGGGGVRYRMLEPIRQYAREKLEEEDGAEEVRGQHASFFLELAEEAEPKLQGPEDVEWLERLEAEHDNIRAALSWALERGEAEPALRLAGALWRFWEAHGHFSEGRRWLEEALAKADGASAAARAKALEGVGQLVFPSGELDRAVIAAQEGLELSKQAGLGGAVEARFLLLSGTMETFRGEDERAKELLEESLVLSREADDEWGIAEALLWLGNSLDFVDRERAKELREEGIALARVLGYVLILGRLLFSQGYVLILEGDYERGAALSEEVVELFREHGYTGELPYVLADLGWAALHTGDPERARAVYEEGLALCAELGEKMAAFAYLDGLACVAGTEGGAERAARLFGAAEALREAVGWPLNPEEEALKESYLGAARYQLDEAPWEGAWAEGRAMSMERAIDYALTEEKHISPKSPSSERSTAGEPSDLTSREREVAKLVARGLTNRQIARELVLSEHTIITHVRNILKKLNLHSRAQLTLWVTERQARP